VYRRKRCNRTTNACYPSKVQPSSVAFTTLVDADTVRAQTHEPQWLTVDCRFSLSDPAWGQEQFLTATIPQSLYAHLDEDLSGPVVPGRTGRHPLPSPSDLAQTFSRLGITTDHQVVAFDDCGGCFAARLWWLLRWMGHPRVAVLDGGLDEWKARGYPLAPGQPAMTTAKSAQWSGRPDPALVADADEVVRAIAAPLAPLVDARAPERYRGDEEPIDAAPGHIPGAINLPWNGNLDSNGSFIGSDRLRGRFESVISADDPSRTIVYCGSGVTACHDVLAMVHAGLPMPRLYPGSWSEWITDPNRPRAVDPSVQRS
jgi:thiosulfate/3-mercaptopyruvate sulfurtransferase